MNVQEVAKRIGISPSLVYALCHDGLMGHTRHGRPGRRGCIRISEEAVEEYLKLCKGNKHQETNSLPLKHITVQ
jgi:excisionase family DNA binding protein